MSEVICVILPLTHPYDLLIIISNAFVICSHNNCIRVFIRCAVLSLNYPFQYFRATNAQLICEEVSWDLVK